MITRTFPRMPFLALPVLVLSASVAQAAGSAADYNGDGRISQEEFRNQVARAAFAADANQNGIIDENEMQFTAEQRSQLDGNGDGKVSVEEYQVGQMKGFAALDRNGDGVLDASEMRGGN